MNKISGHKNDQRIDHKKKKSKGENCNRKGENYKYRLNNWIENGQYQCQNNSRPEAVYMNAWQETGESKCHCSRNDQSNDKVHVSVYLKKTSFKLQLIHKNFQG